MYNHIHSIHNRFIKKTELLHSNLANTSQIFYQSNEILSTLIYVHQIYLIW